jgi:hypothetical protein
MTSKSLPLLVFLSVANAVWKKHGSDSFPSESPDGVLSQSQNETSPEVAREWGWNWGATKKTGFQSTQDDVEQALVDLHMANVAYTVTVKAAEDYLGSWVVENSAKISFVSGGEQGGLMAFIETPTTVYASFRGTQTYSDAKADARSLTRVDYAGAEMGAGWVGHYQTLSDPSGAGSVDKLVETARELSNNRGKTVVATGHSLGGCLATVFYYKLRRAGSTNARLVTFGAPRVFEPQSADWVQENYCETRNKCMRWVNFGDPVTNYPGRTTGFKHVGSCRYIKVRNGEWSLSEYEQDFSAEIGIFMFGSALFPYHKFVDGETSYLTRIRLAGQQLFDGDITDAVFPSQQPLLGRRATPLNDVVKQQGE